MGRACVGSAGGQWGQPLPGACRSPIPLPTLSKARRCTGSCSRICRTGPGHGIHVALAAGAFGRPYGQLHSQPPCWVCTRRQGARVLPLEASMMTGVVTIANMGQANKLGSMLGLQDCDELDAVPPFTEQKVGSETELGPEPHLVHSCSDPRSPHRLRKAKALLCAQGLTSHPKPLHCGVQGLEARATPRQVPLYMGAVCSPLG